MTTATIPGIKCGSCTGRHQTVAEVRTCSMGLKSDKFTREIQRREQEADDAAYAASMDREGWEEPKVSGWDAIATKSQMQFVGQLLAGRDLSTISPKFAEIVEASYVDWRKSEKDETLRWTSTITKKQASQAIDSFLKCPKLAHPRKLLVEELQQPEEIVNQDGMYRNPATGEIFKVQRNRGQGDGQRLYAKRLVLWIDGEKHLIPTAENAEKWNKERDCVEFQYAPGAMKLIKPQWRMTMDEAKQFGALYGTCMRCGRVLTREDSIENMMGSTCASKANWA